ncbi:pilus assembly protein [Roseibium denhamense]|uniref:Flp pilus assembly protein TadG n=1 Tax=Roseibium denhamense TaxID=76305 RepID=A0ABY1P331_9HYPH|nr:TadE/TadG family type IV pilus assembly protein [Roseibium denhamense]MTI05088.1 pilus assembly protein [Roseibium denhamense]SMP22919.1 Flp pilus assembly protein TadG [Roseibium denhamense]
MRIRVFDRLTRSLRSIGRTAQKFGRDIRATAAIEFGLVAIPFLLTLFAIIDLGLAYTVSRLNDNAVAEASRIIRTGQAANGNLSAADIRTEICNAMPSFMCDPDRIILDVTKLDSFTDFDDDDKVGSMYDDDGVLQTNFNFTTGEAEEIIIVRVIYEWPMLFSIMNLSYEDYNGMRHFQSTMVFRNEPFS